MRLGSGFQWATTLGKGETGTWLAIVVLWLQGIQAYMVNPSTHVPITIAQQMNCFVGFKMLITNMTSFQLQQIEVGKHALYVVN